MRLQNLKRAMFDILKKTKIQYMFVAALFFRLLLMPFFVHPDIKIYHFQASFLKHGVIDIYSYLNEKQEELTFKEEFVYFPLAYLALGSYQIVISPLLGNGFETWLSDATQTWPVDQYAYRYLFVLKLPYLVLDLLLGLFMASLVTSKKRKEAVLLFWFFNPFSLLLIYVYSNIDIIPVFLTVASLFTAKKKRFTLSAVLLGLGAAFKAYPLALLPFLVLKADGFKQRVKTALAGLGAFLIVLVPFWSKNLVSDSLASGLTTRIFKVYISLAGLHIPVALILGLLFFFFFWKNVKTQPLYRMYFAATLILLTFIEFHVQWLLWTLPFAVLLVVKEKRMRLITLLIYLLGFSIPLFLQDKSMTVSLFRSLSLVFTSIPIPFSVIARYVDPHKFVANFRFVFTVVALFQLALLTKINKNK